MERRRDGKTCDRQRARSGRVGGHLPAEVPGCVATGATVEEVEREIREAIEFHLEGLREDGLPIPASQSRVEYVDIAA